MQADWMCESGIYYKTQIDYTTVSHVKRAKIKNKTHRERQRNEWLNKQTNKCWRVRSQKKIFFSFILTILTQKSD